MRALVLAGLFACGSSHSATGDGGGGGGGGGGDGGGDGSCCDAARDGSLATGSDAMPCTPSCPTGQWCSEDASLGATINLLAVWAADDDHVFAVGDGGTIVLRRCTGWTAMTSGTTQNLTGVWAANASDAWAVGDSGTLLHYDGSSWSPTSGQTDNFTAVWGSAGNDVWAVGESGIGHHWNGSAWGSTPIGGTLLGISGSSSSDVWTTGESAVINHYTTSWGMPTADDPAGDELYFAVLAVSATDVWVTSAIANKETLVSADHGASWTGHSTSGKVIQGMWARAATDIFGVASKDIGHWDGSSWTFVQPMGSTATLLGVTGTATDAYVVGTGATILHGD
ncbi:MAG TPA: hypothetical protein VMJ10_22225 [Kofleriaceae bacterium]|nr:hypothetical protein [Kofleriaceae bacterium]